MDLKGWLGVLDPTFHRMRNIINTSPKKRPDPLRRYLKTLERAYIQIEGVALHGVNKPAHKPCGAYRQVLCFKAQP
jgi:hypothetical protein